MHVKATSLVIDQCYVVKESNRLLRALFDVAFHSFARSSRAPNAGWVDTATKLLDTAKALDRRVWFDKHPLTQMVGTRGSKLTPDVANLLCRAGAPTVRTSNLDYA